MINLLAHTKVPSVLLWVVILAYIAMRLVPFVIAFRFGPRNFQRWARGEGIEKPPITVADAKSK